MLSKIKVEQISDSEIKVNGSLVFKDANGNWVSPHMMTVVEEQALVEKIKEIENSQQEESSVFCEELFPKDQLMIDIETKGTSSYSVIISIAVVEFNMETGTTGKTFVRNVCEKSCESAGLGSDLECIKWWDDKPELLHSFSKNAKPLTEVLTELAAFIKQKEYKLWGNSARFDLGLIENAYSALGLKTPWMYYNELDVRTLVALFPSIKENTPFLGEKHNPLHDCYHQIKYCHKIWKALKPVKV